MEAEQNAAGCLAELVGHTLSDVSLHLDLVVVRQTVDLVNEHLELDVRVDLVCFDHGEVQHGQRVRVIVLGVDHEHERIARAQQLVHFAGAKRVQFAGQRVDREEQQRIGLDVVLDDLVARAFLQEDRLVSRRLWKWKLVFA